ncbi:hypothetical protein SAMN05428959_11617 [Duganella sp. CF517]|uniref:DUF6445 family protein n=1 Tax=Duganella sp. CF517 TaxID=1881038 RepID=UPI0008C05BBE|nr:DUF6445 family protein [Duganella sp. CF517]SEO64487.1 hypothetical protein SAMN05428959_11617 [Duganella sp. CF517]
MFDPRIVPPSATVTLRPMVNPRPLVQVVPLFDGHQVVIVDNFMTEPETMVEYAALQRDDFLDSPGNYYPGPELPLTGRFVSSVQEAFLLHARTPLRARRVLGTACRLSLATKRPEHLLQGQRMPHRDSYDLEPMEGVGAMVLYLFKDERMGGTSFFKPKLPAAEITALLRELKRMDLAGEAPVLTQPPTFAIASDDHFEKVLTVAPKFNRAIFYNGQLFHSGHLAAPELLVDDPALGRLTVNAFFKLRMAAT